MLHQNYPNPFNPSTELQFDIPVKSNVSLSIYNLLGQIVHVLVDEEKAPGTYRIQWDAKERASGVYFCRMQATSPDGTGMRDVIIKKLLLMK
jgi:hypothetical protein